MSTIHYNLSDLLPREYGNIIHQIIKKIDNCGNDTIVITEDYEIPAHFYDFIAFCHTDNGRDKNKSVIVTRTINYCGAARVNYIKRGL